MDQELNDRLLAFFERPTPIKVAYEPLLEIRGTETRYCLPKDVARKEKEKEKKRESDFLPRANRRHYNIDLENKMRNQDVKLVRGQENKKYEAVSDIKAFTPGITIKTSSSNVEANVFYYL